MNSTSTHRVVTFAPICTMSPPPPSLARHESNSTEASLDSFYWKHGGSDDDDRTNSFEIDDHFTSFGSFDETGSYLMARATLNPLQEDELPTTAMMMTTTTTTTTTAKVPKATHHHRPCTMTMTGQPQPYYARQESAISLLSSWGSLTFEETSSHYSAGSRRTLTYPTMEAKNRTMVMTGGGLLSLSNDKSSNHNKHHHHAMVPRPKLTTALSKKTLLVNYRQESNISLMSSWGSLDLTEQDEESILSQQQKQQTYRDNDDNDDDDASSFGAAVMPTMMRSSSNSVEPGNNSLAAFRQEQQQRLLQRSISLKQLTTEFRKARASPPPSMLQSVKNGYYS